MILGWTATELAARAQVSKTTLWHFEKGQKTPQRATLRILRLTFEEQGLEFDDPEPTFGDGEVQMDFCGLSDGSRVWRRSAKHKWKPRIETP